MQKVYVVSVHFGCYVELRGVYTIEERAKRKAKELEKENIHCIYDYFVDIEELELDS